MRKVRLPLLIALLSVGAWMGAAQAQQDQDAQQAQQNSQQAQQQAQQAQQQAQEAQQQAQQAQQRSQQQGQQDAQQAQQAQQRQQQQEAQQAQQRQQEAQQRQQQQAGMGGQQSGVIQPGQQVLVQRPGDQLIQGQVVKTEDRDISGQEHRFVHLRTKQGQTFQVDLGNTENLPDGFEVKENQWVLVAGQMDRVGNQQAIVAHTWANVYNLAARGGVPAGQDDQDGQQRDRDRGGAVGGDRD